MEKKSPDILLYLLGAGASCNTLPLASDFAERLFKFSDMLTTAAEAIVEFNNGRPFSRVKQPTSYPLWNQPYLEFKEAIIWLAQEASHHASIDTFAKKLYFKKDSKNLKKLKVVLSAYLIGEQQTNHVDLRYDSFFASICQFDIDNLVCLPPNLRVLTWNYDAQLEKAFYGFCEKDELVLKNITYNRSQIRRINGCCGHEFPGTIDDFISAIWDASPYSRWEAAIKLYQKYMDKDCQDTPNICFTWEERISHSLLEDLNKVSIIVVIGYSFPYFNRDMDERIFQEFGVNLKKVYLQCPKDTYESVEKRLVRLLPPLEEGIIRINSTDLFYIPDEF
jgi:hypothetical protein